VKEAFSAGGITGVGEGVEVGGSMEGTPSQLPATIKSAFPALLVFRR